MTHSRHLFVIVLVLAGVACSDVPTQPTAWEIEIEMEVGGGQRWSTSGGPTETGPICAGGSHRWVGYRRQDGSPIDYDEALALTQTHPERVLLESQLDCSDGTGAISIAWRPDDGDPWIIVGGSGAYSGSNGGGSVEVDDDRPGQPRTLAGEISRG